VALAPAALTLCAVLLLPALRQAFRTEFANAVLGLNQSYSSSRQSDRQPSTAGSAAVDVNDHIFLRSVGALSADAEPPPCDGG
jgi:hypothetical protein